MRRFTAAMPAEPSVFPEHTIFMIIEENGNVRDAGDFSAAGAFPEAPENDDLPLIEKAKKGDAAAVEEIYRKYRQKIFSISCRYLHDTEDAADVVQETFINAFKFFYKFNSKSGLSTWLVRICLNLCWHRHRKTVTKHFFEISFDRDIETEDGAVSSPMADGRPPVHDEMEKKQELEKIRSAVDSLKKKYKEIIVLKDLEGYSYEECAGLLGISRGTVMSRLHRARKVLAKKLAG